MPDIEGAHIKITGDTSQAVSEINKLSGTLDSVIDSVKSTSVDITADNSQAVQSVEEVSALIDNVGEVHAEITADSSQAVDETGKASDALENVNNVHAEITADASQALDEANTVSEAVEGISGAEIDITADGSQAVDEFDKVAEASKNAANEALEQWQIDLAKIMNAINSHEAKHPKVNVVFEADTQSMFDRIKSNFSELSYSMSEFSRRFESGFSSILMGIAAKITAVIGSMSVVAKMALSVGGGFEAQMTSVKVISGATEEELAQLTQKAREMGATLPISAKDAATAMTLLAQRGTSVKDILASVTDVANLSISQGVDMGMAADLLGSTLTNFHLDIEDAAKVTNLFNNASNQSALNMSKMTEALKYVGPAAGAVGMDLTEALSAMEASINSVGSAEMVGTGLSTVISKLASKSQILGVRTKNLDGSMRSLKDIFSELQAKGFSLAEATEIFGQRANKVALALANQSSKLEEYQANLQKFGTTQSAVDEKSKTFTNTMAAFRSAIEEINIEIFEQIKDRSKQAVAGVTELVRTFSSWVQETQIANKVLDAFIHGLGFNIPSGKSLKKFLDEIDIQAVVDKFNSFGRTFKDFGETLVSAFNAVKAPLSFLIEHLELFAKISFWGWIIDKGFMIPKFFVDLAVSIGQFYNVVKLFNATIFTPLLTFLANPVVLGVAGGLALGAYTSSRTSQKNREAEQKREIQEEIAANDWEAELLVNLNFETGFEELPAAFDNASSEVQQKINEQVAVMQSAFRNKIILAVNEVNEAFSDMGDRFTGTANEIDNAIATKITQAMQGSKDAFNSLPEYWKKVVEQINFMDIEAGKSLYSSPVYSIIQEYKALQLEAQKVTKSFKVNEVADFSQSLANNISELINGIPANLERMQKFMQGQNLELPINVQLSQAYNQLKEFAKSAAEKYGIPEDIVNAGIFSRLKRLAEQGNKTAQSLVNGWSGVGNTFDTFMQNARDAIQYLGASPETFIPALNKLTKNIQRIDPLTGKVTEQFKKAYNALKEWGNVTFDKLSQRIQRLRKAVEEGFIDKSALEREFQNVSEQLKIKVVADLKSDRGMYKSQSAYESVIASEYISRLGDIGGETFMDMSRKQFEGRTGSSIGHSILNSIKSYGSTAPKQGEGFINIQSISQALNPVALRLEQIASQKQETNNYSVNIAQVISEIRYVKEAVISLENTVRAQPNIAEAVTSLETAIKAIPASSVYDIDINQQGFNVGSKSVADNLAHSTANFMQVGLGNGGL